MVLKTEPQVCSILISGKNNEYENDRGTVSVPIDGMFGRDNRGAGGCNTTTLTI